MYFASLTDNQYYASRFKLNNISLVLLVRPDKKPANLVELSILWRHVYVTLRGPNNDFQKSKLKSFAYITSRFASMDKAL